MLKWGDKNYALVVGKESLIFKKVEEEDLIVKIKDLKPSPNIPFYQYLFEKDIALEGLDKHKKFTNLVAVMPDDALVIDEKIISEYCMQHLGTKKMVSVTWSQVISLEENEYISVAKTARCIVVAYVKDHMNTISHRLDKGATPEEMAQAIEKLQGASQYGTLPVYINNMEEDLTAFGELGQLVDRETFMTNVLEFRKEIVKTF